MMPRSAASLARPEMVNNNLAQMRNIGQTGYIPVIILPKRALIGERPISAPIESRFPMSQLFSRKHVISARFFSTN